MQQRAVIDNVQVRPSDAKARWLTAYRRFLLSRNEPLLLKIAPLVLVGILPPDILTNLIPGIGFLDDAGYVVLVAYTVYQTITRVNRYR